MHFPWPHKHPYSGGGANVKHSRHAGRKKFRNVCATPQTFAAKNGDTDYLAPERELHRPPSQIANGISITEPNSGCGVAIVQERAS